MNDVFFATLFGFVVTYFIHSSIFIGVILVAIKLKAVTYDRLGEWLIKSALVIGVFTALIQTNGWLSKYSLSDMQWTYQQKHSSIHLTRDDNLPAKEFSQSPYQAPATKTPSHKSTSSTKENQPQGQFPVKLLLPNIQAKSQSVPFWAMLWLVSTVVLYSIFRYRRNQFLQLICHRQSIKDEAIIDTWNKLLTTASVNKSIRLTQCNSINTPIALAKEVVMPSMFIIQNDLAHIKAAMAHELAHIKRHDTQWLAFSQVFQVVTFFQPLNNFINQHIHQIAEQRADTLAAKWTQNPKALAVTLAANAKVISEDTQSIKFTQMVPAMTSNKSNLLLRVENLLNRSERQTARYWFVCFTALLTLILFTSPGVVAKSNDSNHNHRIVSIEDNGDGITDMSISYSNNEKSLKLKSKLKGELKFNDDETAITSFPPNSKFDLRIEEDGTETRLVIKSKRTEESVQYTYSVDGDELPYNAAAQAWFARAIPEVLRTTGLDSKGRVNRIQQSHGDAAVLNEIELIKSDWVKKLYFGHLFELTELSQSNLTRAMDLAAGISSDFELSHVLSKLSETQVVESESQWLNLLNSTDSMQSDFELSKTLINFLDQLPQSSDINQAYFDAAATIQSDFEMSKVLIAYMDLQPPNSLNMIHMFKLADEIQSDFELAKLLLNVNSQLTGSEDEFEAYINLATSIQSDFEMKKVYSNLLEYDLPNDNLSQMLQSAKKQINSDFELANLLLEILDQKQLSEDQRDQIAAVARDSINSQFERNKVLNAAL